MTTDGGSCGSCGEPFKHHGDGAICGHEDRHPVWDRELAPPRCALCLAMDRRICHACCKQSVRDAMEHGFRAHLATLGAEPPNVNQVVYLIEAAEVCRVKIGSSSSGADARLRAHQTGSPVALRLVCAVAGDQALEFELHRRFARHRAHGEWFADAVEIREWFAARLGQDAHRLAAQKAAALVNSLLRDLFGSDRRRIYYVERHFEAA